jgi:hypothetical protein
VGLRPDSFEPLAASARVTDADFAGVVRVVSDVCRVSVNMACSKYLLQHPQTSPEGVVWVGPSFSSLGKLLAFKGAPAALFEACAGLPDLPALAAPVFARRRADLLAAFTESDWRRQDYAGVIVQDGNLRLVVTPCGGEYRLQWIYRGQFLAGDCDCWRSICISADLRAIENHIRVRIFNTESLFEQPCQLLLLAMVDLPRFAADRSWPDLPSRP